MHKRQVAFVIFLVIQILFILHCSQSIAADQPSKTYWEHVRAQHLFPSQDFIASPQQQDGSRFLVILEPPSGAFQTRANWEKQIFGSNLVSEDVDRQPMGFDGWASDIVLTLKNFDDADIANSVSKLSASFFGTDYKASFQIFDPKPWDAVPQRRKTGAPNVTVGTRNLFHWLFERALTFSPTGAASTVSAHSDIKVLLGFGHPGVFYSDSPGLAVLIVDRHLPLFDQRMNLRKFLLDSDAILGAVAGDGGETLALVGRERTTSVEDLPPLRMDTVFTLAANKSTDLAQSYERNSLSAGKILSIDLSKAMGEKPEYDLAGLKRVDDNPFMDKIRNMVGVDWAPIYLSQELTNSEFGQLLNITDQMLKGWSQAGHVTYANFAYPSPHDYPFREGLFEHLMATTMPTTSDSFSLTYNWNTAGFGTIVQNRQFRLFAVPITGALPVTYIPDADGLDDEAQKEEMEAIADTYWRYFANLRDPYLEQVAEYTALHRIFQAFPVNAQRTEPLTISRDYASRWDKFSTLVLAALKNLKTDLGKPGGSAENIKAHTGDECVSQDQADMSDAINGELPKISSVLQDASSSQLAALSLTYPQASPEALNELALSQLMQTSGTPGSNSSGSGSADTGVHKGFLLWGTLERDGKFMRAFQTLVSRYIDCNQAWKAVSSNNSVESDLVQRTPSIVVSKDRHAEGTGGHNLDGASLTFRLDSKVPSGSLEYDDDFTIFINPSDSDKIDDISHLVQRENGRPNDSQLEALLRNDKSTYVEFGNSALGREGPDVSLRGLVLDYRRHPGTLAPSELSSAELAQLGANAAFSDADIVLQVKDGARNIIRNRPPPTVIRTNNPAEFQQGFEAVAGSLADSGTKNGSSVMVVADQSDFSFDDMLSLKESASSREPVASSGGGIKPPGDGHQVDLLFDDTNGGRKSLKIFARGKSKPSLIRKLLGWKYLSYDRALIKEAISDNVAYLAMDIQIKQADGALSTPIHMVSSAIFRSRKATSLDAEKLLSLTLAELDKPSAELQSRIVAVRDNYKSAVQDCDHVRFGIKAGDDDFHIVMNSEPEETHG